jgi:ribonucleoside-diphosphate reductase alpha chain
MKFQIKKLSAPTPTLVHDIQVADTHTFTIGECKAVVHNCYLSFLPDSSDGLVDTYKETCILSMLGGGVGVGVGLRTSDDKSTGVLAHMKTYDSASMAYKQGSTRRGSFAMYLDISHPEIIPFLEMRKPTGDANTRCTNLNHAVNIPDAFMHIIERCMKDSNANDDWPLIDPFSKEVTKVVSAKALWSQLLKLRKETGEPYFLFIDTANKKLPHWQKKLGLKIRQSNLCSEITLPVDENRTAICVLSSANAEYYDEWKNDNLFISDVMEMLDNVLQYFIDNAPDSIARARFSAQRERSVGLGLLGLHAYFQKNNVAFGSPESRAMNIQIFKQLDDQSLEASERLGVERGANLDYIEGGGDMTKPLRFSHRCALAPNASSSLILGNTSPSAEPFRANCYRQDTLSGFNFHRNPYLDKLIIALCAADKKLDRDDIWSDINAHDGSIQHSDLFDAHTKDVFKTAMEIDQQHIIDLAADRQPHIDQAQSVNVFTKPNVTTKVLHDIHFNAWKQELKTLYYLRSEKLKSTEKISKTIKRVKIDEQSPTTEAVDSTECIACQ